MVSNTESSNSKSIFANLKSDLPASLVVFLIALPLSLGIALASGAPMKAGLIAAAVGGIIVGFFTGAPLQVSGPAAGLSVMMFGLIQKFGFEATAIITVIAGLTQILFGYLGAAQLTFIISPSVIHAMLAGIGILIVLGQVHVLLGFAPKSSAILNIFAYPDSLIHMNQTAAFLGVLTLAILLAWNQWGQKKVQYIPGSLIAVVGGTLIGSLMQADVPHVQLSEQLFSGFQSLKFGSNNILDLVLSGLGVALVASAESLLCAVATDKLHSGPRVHLRKELIAQGIGNTVSGLLGGLPVTGVIVRSSANVSSGAKTKLSPMLHGVWVLLFSILFASTLNKIPLSVLAALLIYTGIKLVKIAEIKKLMVFKESVVYFATLMGVVFINLLWGIGIGFVLATILMIVKMAKFQFIATKNENCIQVLIVGNLTFFAVPRLLKELNGLPKKSEIHILLEVDHLDHAVIEAMNDWRLNYEKEGGRVFKSPLVDLWNDLKRPYLDRDTRKVVKNNMYKVGVKSIPELTM